MQNISNLIQEAKPLYFTRKRRRKQIKTTLCSLVLLIGLGMFYPQTTNIDYGYMLISENEYNYLQNTGDGSCIEDMGMPVDDYGLLMVG